MATFGESWFLKWCYSVFVTICVIPDRGHALLAEFFPKTDPSLFDSCNIAPICGAISTTPELSCFIVCCLGCLSVIASPGASIAWTDPSSIVVEFDVGSTN